MYTKYFEVYKSENIGVYRDTEYFISVVKFKGDEFRKVLPVKTNVKISSTNLIDCSKAVRKIFISDSIRFGDIICKNIINSGADIISIKTHELELK